MPAEFEHATKAAKRVKVSLPKDGPFDINTITPEELLAMVKKVGGQRAFSRKYAVKRTTLQNRLYQLRKDPFSHRPVPQPRIVPVNETTGRQRFILSSAQDKTHVHEGFVDNLEAYCAHLSKDAPCEIMIAGFTYSKRLFEDHAKGASFYHRRVMDYLVAERVRLADRIDFCGEMNTLPTAENPLSGFHSYTRERWGIFPHAKVQLVSVPTMKHTPSKQIMTTGAVTKPNYVPKKAGIKASFHHQLGAVVVEIDADGTFFCRHILADDDGSFYDLTTFVQDGIVTEGHTIECLTPGDVHVAQIDPEVSQATFGIAPTSKLPDGSRLWSSKRSVESMLTALKPAHLFVHDVSDFRARNHHNIADPHDRYRLFINGSESVASELAEVAMFLSEVSIRHPSMAVTVVESNHDLALNKWLKTADYRLDPVNAEFFLECQRAVYEAIRTKRKGFSIFEHVMRNSFAHPCDRVRFLREDESCVVGGVEHSNHGHNGANGSRGNIQQFAKIGPRVTFGHTHSPGIFDGAVNTGTTSLLDMGYNTGPSSWAHTHCVQYHNGKRALVTLQNGRWRL